MFEISAFIEAMSGFSQSETAVSRLPFTAESQEAFKFIERCMERIGLTVYTDRYGTLLGYLKGRSERTVMIGSHYDSVVNGGRFDGLAGLAVGLAAADYFSSQNLTPPVSLLVLATNDEEGVRFSSGFLSTKALCGKLDESSLRESKSGVELSEFLNKGYYGEGVIRLAEDFPDLFEFLEVHIEQGGVLDEAGQQMGLVESIFGLRRVFIEIEGMGNHAGTTPMPGRKDALVLAAKVIAFCPEAVSKYVRAVATVGQIENFPNVVNVIPSRVRFSIDVRSYNDADRDAVVEAICAYARQEAAQSGLRVNFEESTRTAACPLNTAILDRLESLVSEREISYRRMDSGATHDAQVLAEFYDTAMLFIPSKEGISHDPKEFSRNEDIELAAEIVIDYLASKEV